MYPIKRSISSLFYRNPSQKFLPEIDALRFFAIIPVLIMHFGTAFLDQNSFYIRESIEQVSLLRAMQLQGGGGVALFFTISGFIVSLPFFRRGMKGFSFPRYIFRRLLRLQPPYAIALLIFFVVHFFLNQQSLSFLVERLIASLFYLHTLIFDARPYILPVAWSLEVEIQFYFIIPLLMFVLLYSSANAWKVCFYLFFFIGSNTIDLFQSHDLSDYLSNFLAGILVADIMSKNRQHNRHNAWDIVFIVSIILYYVFRPPVVDFFLLCLILFSALHTKLLESILKSKILVIIGGMCYSLYLLHYPMYILFMKLFSDKMMLFDNYAMNFLFQSIIFIPLSILLIAPFYLLIEKPCMNLKFLNK